jgi:hypothetical protein
LEVKMTTEFLGFKTAPYKAKLLRELEDEGKIASQSDGLDQGLTMILQFYGKLPVPHSPESKEESKAEEGA